jgi:hypothetical protein
MIPKVKELRRVVPVPKQNNNSIVLWIQFNDIFLLLGADLEETKDPRTGWQAILNSKLRPKSRAKIFKIPHHGSPNAHSDGVWESMIDPIPISVLTSKIGGGNSIPKDSDIERIKKYSNNLFCTRVPTAPKIKRDRTVEKMYKAIVKERQVISGEIGHIQIRFAEASEIQVNHSHPAVKI